MNPEKTVTLMRALHFVTPLGTLITARSLPHMISIVHLASTWLSYVGLAARLGRDAEFRNHIVDLIDQRQWALWERRDEARMFLN